MPHYFTCKICRVPTHKCRCKLPKVLSEGSLSESRSPAKVVDAVASGWGLVIRDMQGDELWRGPHDGAPWTPGCNAVVNKHTRRIVHTHKTTTEETVFVATASNTEVTDAKRSV